MSNEQESGRSLFDKVNLIVAIIGTVSTVLVNMVDLGLFQRIACIIGIVAFVVAFVTGRKLWQRTAKSSFLLSIGILSVVVLLVSTLFLLFPEILEKHLTPMSTMTPITPMPAVTQPEVHIIFIEYNPPGAANEEYVLIENRGDEIVDMSNWTLEDEDHRVFRFPAFLLGPGATVRIWTKDGQNSSVDLYWGYQRAVWNNDGDAAYLKDSTGELVDHYSYKP